MTSSASRHELLGGEPTRLLVDGQWRDGSEAETIAVIDPATEQVLTEIAAASPADGVAAVDVAHHAGQQWAKRTPRERAEILRRAYELMIAEQDRFARLIVLENGKAMADARGEVAYAAEFFRWYAEEAVRNLGTVTTSPTGSNRIVVLHQPIGVALLVTPWNFPAAMATRKIGPALAAGCPVILKPASETPLTALAVGEVLERAGVPAGVINVLPSRHAGPFVNAVLADSRVRKLSFTGSTEVGSILLAEAAKTIVSCSMELGGNAPFVVFEDADIDAAVAGAMVAKMRNGGQACTAANRIYVAATVADEFTSKFAAAMGKLVVGSGLDSAVEVGPLINSKALDYIAGVVDRAQSAGAELVTGGVHDGAGYFYKPSVLFGVPADAELLREEIFGPVAPVVTFGPDDDVVALANDTGYGLASYVYTRDLARAMRVSEALEYGMVGINRGLVSDPAAPFGGVKQSGLGREGGHEGMREYTESKYLSVDWTQ